MWGVGGGGGVDGHISPGELSVVLLAPICCVNRGVD